MKQNLKTWTKLGKKSDWEILKESEKNQEKICNNWEKMGNFFEKLG